MKNNTFLDRVLPQLRDELQRRREARAARRDLELQLASFRSPAEINELLLLISNQDTPGADEVREVLSNNLAAFGSRAA